MSVVSRLRAPLAIAGLVLFCVAAAGVRSAWSLRRAASVNELLQAVPGTPRDDGFVSSDTCQACHPDQYSTWHASFHRTMTQIASPQAVLGDFSGVAVEHQGRVYRFLRRGDEYRVDVDGREKRVALTTGSHHYQVYWVPSDEGPWLVNVPLVFLLEDRRWVPRNDVFLLPPEAGAGPWKSRVWNVSCIQCHSTHPRPRYDPDAQAMDTQVAEFGIACEACHGPSREHVQRNHDPRRRYRMHGAEEADSTIVNPRRLAHDRASEICGQCHGIFGYGEWDTAAWYRRGYTFRAGQDLEATRFVARHPLKVAPEQRSDLVRELKRYEIHPDGFFWGDGMVRVSGREFNGLIESPCYKRGDLSCLSCHSMHDGDPDDQLTPGVDGDATCLQCHERFRADVARHTHHAPDSSGSRCLDCHMPYTTYGILKAIRSHEIDSPSVEVGLRGGRPNACNLCHLDRSLGWAAQYLREWYEAPPVALSEEERDVSAGLLWLLKGDAGQRAIVAWHFGWQPALEASRAEWMAPFLARLLDDPYSTVRYVAYRSLRRLPGYAEFPYDFVAEPAERARAVQRALEAWPGAGDLVSDDEVQLAPLLLQADGSVAEPAVADLLQRRNNRKLYLLE